MKPADVPGEDVEQLVNACDLVGAVISDDIARGVLASILSRHEPLGGAFCFSCGSELPVDVDSLVNAVLFHAEPGYGSDFDGEGEMEIVVCDSCLSERSARVARLTTTQVARTRREAWEGSR